eukprot:gnl/TRDRNA2_/TRDRNA2_192786_c0_seq1.p1 gnl/TRDRNA2_/TRDRNA2_192786_c0~~gnl/TRDRNA2_/TRDRNA2_192786_c0_seq1.p1  ORF type:complete len:332 (+),score=56.49 gnl/TRDRNA2_/TRDRNA2_192786_c0_seq1:95-1090(+)
MCRSITIILLALFASACVNGQPASSSSDAQDKLLDRVREKSPFHNGDLDWTTLAKPGDLAISRGVSAKPFRPPRASSFLPHQPAFSSSSVDAAPHWVAQSPQLGRMDSRLQTCAVGKVESERVDPNLTPGAVGKLKPIDSPDKLEFDDVQVRVYNIDRYGLGKMGAKALNKNIEGIWHVGVAVFGKEYWFGSIVEEMDLSNAEYAFGFGPTHTYDIGKTTVDPKEFDDWVFDAMVKKYNVEAYDCFNHNCHHFANDLVVKLTGKTPDTGGFPQWCLDHGEKGLSEVGDKQAEQIRWVSNRIAKIMMVSWGKYNRDRFKDTGDNPFKYDIPR